VEALHLALAPTATDSQSTGITIIDESERLIALSELVCQQYEQVAKALENPIGRPVIRQMGGKKMLG